LRKAVSRAPSRDAVERLRQEIGTATLYACCEFSISRRLPIRSTADQNKICPQRPRRLGGRKCDNHFRSSVASVGGLTRSRRSGEAPPCTALWSVWDTFRSIVTTRRRDAEAVHPFTRRGYDWTDRYPAIMRAAAKLRARSFTIDGVRPRCAGRMELPSSTRPGNHGQKQRQQKIYLDLPAAALSEALNLSVPSTSSRWPGQP
jgi:hypothetical protein